MDTRTRVWITGDCDGLDALARELEAARTSVYRAPGTLLELAARLAAARPEAILHGSRDGGDAAEVAAIREHTRAPVVLVTTGRSAAVVDEALAAGVADVVFLPQPVEAVLFSLRKLTAR